MKKYLMSGIAALSITAAFTSCSNKDDFEPMTQEQIQEAKYAEAFVKVFGQPAANQTWGFKQTNTRTAYPNGNMWVSEGYNWPADITESERDAVLEVFSQKGEASYEALVDWDCFFVQQVYKGDSIYKDGYNQNVCGAEHMDWLCAYDPEGHKEIVYGRPEYNWQPTEITSHDDHVNNFNNSYSNDYGGRMLMRNSSTQRFGFKSSTDNGHIFYNFRMEEINGNYYVGLDFEAAGQNPNEQVSRDTVYNDWIVKIVPGTGQTPPPSDRVKEEGIIICEDLGTLDDFDFNDVVFYAKVWESGKTEITLYAAGGTLELSVAGIEVHEKFGVQKGTNGLYSMINTGAGVTKEPQYFIAANNYANLVSIPVVVTKTDAAGNVTSYALTAEIGQAPQKICVPLNFKWCKERASLVDAYPGFKNWTTGAADTWAGEWNSQYVYNAN